VFSPKRPAGSPTFSLFPCVDLPVQSLENAMLYHCDHHGPCRHSSGTWFPQWRFSFLPMGHPGPFSHRGAWPSSHTGQGTSAMVNPQSPSHLAW
jgi:hypothetical protein